MKRVMRKEKLVCRDTAFYTQLDEDAFFYWIDKIPSVIEKKGLGNELYIYVDRDKVSKIDLENFLALFHKYDIDMSQLSVFLNNKNKSWFFDNKEAYWHDKVFLSKEELKA